MPRPAHDCRQQKFYWEDSDNALATYTLFFGLLALGQLPQLRLLKFAELPYFLGLACLTIYIGAHRGLTSKVGWTAVYAVFVQSSFYYHRPCPESDLLK